MAAASAVESATPDDSASVVAAEAPAIEQPAAASRETPGTSDYYQNWDRYGAEGEERDEEEEARQRALAAALPEKRSPLGYEFRKGRKTQFPEIENETGENDEEAAYRVAGERRNAGNEAFSDGTVWGAQMAVDAWGQGILALERLRNLRKYRKAREETEASDQKALIAASDAEVATECDEGSLDATSVDALADRAYIKLQRETEAAKASAVVPDSPSDHDLYTLLLAIRLNLAQALLKLRDFESAIGLCDGALELDPLSTKAWWRKAKAVWGVRNPGLAREALNRLLELDPGNAAALALLREIDLEEEKKRSKRVGPRPFRFPSAADAEKRRAAKAAAPTAKLKSDGEDAGDSSSEDEALFALPSWCCRRRTSQGKEKHL